MRTVLAKTVKIYMYIATILFTLNLLVTIAFLVAWGVGVGSRDESLMDKMIGGSIVAAIRSENGPEQDYAYWVYAVANAMNISIKQGRQIDKEFADRVWIGAMRFELRDGLYVCPIHGSEYEMVVEPVMSGSSISKFEWREPRRSSDGGRL